MKITIYELLGLIKNGKAPEKIKYKTFELKRTMSNNLFRMYVDEEGVFFPEYYSGLALNEEIEILENLEEEKKIPEKIKDKYCSQISKVELAQKYNEIIDYLDYLKSKGE